MTTISHPTHLLNNLLELRAFTLIASYLPHPLASLRSAFPPLRWRRGGKGVRLRAEATN